MKSVAGLLLALLASPAGALELTLWPAWEGYWRPGRATELEVRLHSDSPGPVTVTLEGGEIPLEAQLDLAAGAEAILHLPLRPRTGQPVTVTARDGAGDTASRTWQPLVASAPLVAVAPGLLPGLPGQRLTPAAATLPRHGQTYANLVLVVLDRALLTGLKPRQLAALEQHLGRCGRLVAIGLDERLAAGLGQLAGCGGRYLAVVSPTDAQTQAARLLALPDLPEPRPAGQWQAGGWQWPLLLYPLLPLALVPLARGRLVWLAPLGAGLLLVGLALRPPTLERVGLARGEPGDRVVTYQARLRITGSGLGRRQLTLPPWLGLPQGPLPGRMVYGDDSLTLGLAPPLLTTVELTLNAALPLDEPLQTALAGDLPAELTELLPAADHARDRLEVRPR